MSATPPVAVVGPVLVIGTGLIGTSIALALTRAGVRVLLDDVDSEPITIAVNRGAGEVFDHENSHVPPFAIVVIAVPPRFAAQVIAQASQDFPTSTITDVTSVKSGILQQAIAMGADASRLVGGHPMAGREVAGAVGARKDLFDDRLWIVSPCQEAGALHHQNVTNLAITCGAVPIDMSPQEHDRAVALVSHAPQVVSSALAAQLLPAQANHIAVAGQGLRDMTRIAASDSSLWVDILSQNAGPVSEVLNGVVRELQEVLDALQELANGDQDNEEKIDATLKAGVKGRARIPGRHGSVEAPFIEVAVLIEDKPGELGRLFVAAGDAGVNLEDVRIEHVLGKPSGLVELSVRPEVADELVQELSVRGFDVRGFA